MASKFLLLLYASIASSPTPLPLHLQALLGSKVQSDVIESINFFVTARKFKLETADDGIRAMLPLVWSKEPVMRDAVLDAFKTLFLAKV